MWRALQRARSRLLSALAWGLVLATLLRGQSRDAEVRPLLEQAQQAQQQGDLPAAAEAYARLGMLYRRLGRLAEAAESLERAQRLDSKLPRVGILLALTYIDAGRCRDAIPLLAAGLDAEQHTPVGVVVGRRLAECHLETGDEASALAAIHKLRQVTPDDPDVLQLAMKTYMTSWNGAFQRLLAKAPGSVQLRQIMAEGLESQERFAEAAQEYREILKMDPKLPGMHYKLGQMILRSDASPEADEKALAQLRRELEISPAHAGALAEVGEIHLRRSQLDEAGRSFSQALQAQAGYLPARLGLAKTCIAQKQWARALEQLEPVAKLASDNESVAYNLMLAYRGLGRAAEAKRALETFQRLKEQNQRARSSLLKGPAPK